MLKKLYDKSKIGIIQNIDDHNNIIKACKLGDIKFIAKFLTIYEYDDFFGYLIA